MMMKKIWGLIIVFCCCFVSVSFGQETIFNLAGPVHPALVQTDVDVSIEKNGLLTFQAEDPLLKGKINMKVVEKITLVSGDYAGWGYALIEYKAGNLKGDIYYVFHNDEGRGMLSGDAGGVARQVSGIQSDMTWEVADVEGTETRATINLAFESYKPGKIIQRENIWMPVLPDFTLAADGYSQSTTVLLLPAPDGNPHNARKFKGGGLEFGTYQAGRESGTLWSFLDNTKTVDPFSQRRLGTRDGVLAGTSEVIFESGAGGSAAVNMSTLLAQ